MWTAERLCGAPLSVVSDRPPLWLTEGGHGVLLSPDGFGMFPWGLELLHIHVLAPGDLHVSVGFPTAHALRRLPIIGRGPEGADLSSAMSRVGSLGYRLRVRLA